MITTAAHICRTSSLMVTLPVTIKAQRTFFFIHRDPLTYHRLSHLPSLASATQTPSKPADCAPIVYISRPVSGLSLLTIDILNAPFHSYCMYHSTLDPLPIRLVVDRPLWTSSVYIRRPLLR